VVGSLLGLILGALFLGMLAIVLAKLFIERDVAGAIDFPVMGFLQTRIRTSFLLPYFRDYILPLIYSSVRPVLPREADIIFTTR
jgi:membrane protein required for colicin V production